ncbi:uncharacterized protein KNAG_0A06270 [Huiozyma naganishii CBS 8797]|uniref:Phosphoglycerate mutase n=1 Tax=Huiozyma naganishii (strain ATCC MYA-139 / BCRC 22969 / CBS 8797 / KCTC 17520 / NBRC 10181 / NCYC 3082 / Yp74L-3) TaxID=1071383 RepID=J7RFF9_HUIN7|nr:hypothetical protein KNAG_0A06270 [Kazachstania naganishii CBS 8797]CCK68288.1 hypothetical protein KNAG_0A06270 [Kazachstania naganishii CBS 8797]
MAFKALPGYFSAYPELGFPGIDSSEEDHLKLVNHSAWKELYESIPQDTGTHHYKLLVIARHGQGYHNAAILRYGEPRWNEYWSLLNGDEFGEWVDSKLTPLGYTQVKQVGKNVLLPMINELGFLPHKFFCSPMRRCLETFIGSWTNVFHNHCNTLTLQDCSVTNVVIENIREKLGEHTCDKRVNHSITVGEYQDFQTDSGHTIQWDYTENYPEEDQLWLPDRRETDKEIDERIHEGLREIFNQLSTEDKFISITCHSGVIGSILRNMKHPAINNLDTGKIVCLVTEIEK